MEPFIQFALIAAKEAIQDSGGCHQTRLIVRELE